MSFEHSSDVGTLDRATAVFLDIRPRLFGIAYRMLGTVAEAEDVVQETWLRWQAADRSVVVEPEAYLVSITTRLAINISQSARSRRETYIGPWLPEPVDTVSDPSLGAERGEALELAVMFLLEKLPPVERAAYVLREAFDYSYHQVAAVLEITESNARQIVSRARKHIASERRIPSGKAEQERLLRAFITASQQGELSALEQLLGADAISYSDGGGAVRAATAPVYGRTRIAKFIASFASHWWNGVTVTWVQANGAPAAFITREGQPYGLVTIETSGGEIDRIFWVINPAKLASISAPTTASL
ncbi:MAG TPA: RNA polymerase sigma-70 factor [Edaphobacter sp.]|nr:RNA polymerase sigma-70 factor [Edaphobacter sp.]